MNFNLRWVSFKQHMYGFCFRIYSATLCLFIGVFNSFTFNVIIDRYIGIAILSHIFYLHLVFSSFLLLTDILFTFFFKIGWVIMNSLPFSPLGSSLSLLQF